MRDVLDVVIPATLITVALVAATLALLLALGVIHADTVLV
jgi:hypothetical protein